MYFLLDFTVEEPLRSNLITLIACWPVISGCLLMLAVQWKIKAVSQPKRHTRSTVILTVAIVSIALYDCFCGAIYMVYMT